MMYGDPAMGMGNQLMLTSGPGMGQPEQYQQGGYAPQPGQYMVRSMAFPCSSYT